MGTRNLTLIWYKGKWHIAQYGQWDGYPDGQGKTIVKFITNTQEEDPEVFEDDDEKENIGHQHKPRPEPDATRQKDTVVKDNVTALKAAIDGKVLYIPTKDECKEWDEDCQKILREAQKSKESMNDSKMLWDVMTRPMMLVQPSMARDLGGQILSVVAHAKDKIPIELDLEFILDGLFCEWSYVIDLDENVLEVYRGDRGDGGSRTGERKGLVDPARFRDLLAECTEREEKALDYDKKSEPRLVASYGFEELKQLGVDGFIADMK